MSRKSTAARRTSPPACASSTATSWTACSASSASTRTLSAHLRSTCAAEKRRRRKRGTFPDPARRIFIHEAVCEGCGDCGVQSNCVAIEPVETELGRKRRINQSSCNKDYSCTKGFCPSFVTVEGARLRKGRRPPARAWAKMRVGPPAPQIPGADTPYGLLITGIGGTA